MRKPVIVIGLGLVIFFAGIISIQISVISREGFVEHKEIMCVLHGSNITDTAILFPQEGRCGINLSGSFQGFEGQSIFVIRDFESRLVYSSPSFPAPSNNIEFDIDEPGFYSIYFNIIVSDDSCVEVYRYTYTLGTIYPYENLYNIGIFVSIAGIIASAVGVFIPSKGDEES